MLCNSVRAVFVGVLFTHTVCWLEVFLQATETVLTLKKRQDLKNAQNSNYSSSTGFDPTLTMMTELFAGWPSIKRSCLQVSPRPFVEPPTCFRVNCVVIFFVALKLLSFSLSYLLTVGNGPVFFLGPCQALVMQSFAFSFARAKSGR